MSYGVRVFIIEMYRQVQSPHIFSSADLSRQGLYRVFKNSFNTSSLALLRANASTWIRSCHFILPASHTSHVLTAL